MKTEDIALHGNPIKIQIKDCISPGVYFLLKNGVVVYIGQSLNVASRIGQHYKSRLDFDDAYYIEVNEKELNDKECELILTYLPAYNSTYAMPLGKKYKHLRKKGDKIFREEAVA